MGWSIICTFYIYWSSYSLAFLQKADTCFLTESRLPCEPVPWSVRSLMLSLSHNDQAGVLKRLVLHPGSEVIKLFHAALNVNYTGTI